MCVYVCMCVYVIWLKDLAHLNACTNKTIHSLSHTHTHTQTHTHPKHPLTFLPQLVLALAGPRTLPSGRSTTHGPAKVNKPGPGTYRGRGRERDYRFEPSQDTCSNNTLRKQKGGIVCNEQISFVDDRHFIQDSLSYKESRRISVGWFSRLAFLLETFGEKNSNTVVFHNRS